MTAKFSVRVETGPDVTGEVTPEATRFDIYINGEHDTHTDNEHTGFWGQITLPKPLPAFYEEIFDATPEGLSKLRTQSWPAYWYAAGLLDAAELMDDFEYDPTCKACQEIVKAAALDNRN